MFGHRKRGGGSRAVKTGIARAAAVCLAAASMFASAGYFGRRSVPDPASAAPPRGKTRPVMTSANNAGLRDYLRSHPEADADGDGILTLAESALHRNRAVVDAYLNRRLRGGGQIPGINLWTQHVAGADFPATLADIPYGPHARNRLDLWLAESAEPCPALIFIHGGGFSQGEKGLSLLQATLLNMRLPVTAVSINYRYATETPFPASFEDAARAVQFVRSRAGEWNIDPGRIAVAGSSAGGILALWLGLHDDLADAEDRDPVGRESSRASCILAWGAPVSFDPVFVRKRLGGPPEIHPDLPRFFGVGNLADLNRPEIRRQVLELSPVTHLSADDPPLFLTGEPPPRGLLPEDSSHEAAVHNAKNAVVLKEMADALGMECHAHWDGNEPKDGLARAQIIFLMRHLGLLAQ